jgi:hypothetical protein
MKKMMLLVTLFFGIVGCANQMIIHEPNVFETGNIPPKGRIEGAVAGTVLPNLTTSMIVLPALPSGGLMLGYSFSDYFNLKARGNFTPVPGGSLYRYQLTSTIKFLNHPWVRSSTMLGAALSGYKASTSNTITHVSTTAELFVNSYKGSLNLGFYPFGQIFVIYGNIGIDYQIGSVNKGPKFNRTVYLAGGGVGLEGDKVSCKLGMNIPLDNEKVLSKSFSEVRPGYFLYYMPSIGMEVSYSFDPGL